MHRVQRHYEQVRDHAGHELFVPGSPARNSRGVYLPTQDMLLHERRILLNWTVLGLLVSVVSMTHSM